MKKLLILLLFPVMIFAQESIIVGDVDCSGEVNSEDASLILQFVTNVINELPCQDNMIGLTPEQLQEIINMMDGQLSINYSGGSSNYPIMISSISTETMSVGDAFVYCNDLEEGGNTDWFLPNLDQILYAISGGCELPDERSDDHLWSAKTRDDASGDYYTIPITDGIFTYTGSSNLRHCRCVRFGEGETSEGSSGSGSSILGNSEQPIAMIGPMYIEAEYPDFEHTLKSNSGVNYNINGPYDDNSNKMFLLDAVRFCSQLDYEGHDDWFLPSLNQVINYIENSESLFIIPNIYEDNLFHFGFIDYVGNGVSTGIYRPYYGLGLSGPENSDYHYFCVR